jgi:hypothetical protein
VPALWMLALLAADSRRRRWWPAGIALAWLAVAGAPPLPDRLDLLVAGLGQAVLIGLSAWAILRRPPAVATATTPESIVYSTPESSVPT